MIGEKMAKQIIFADGNDFLRRDGLAVEPAAWEDGMRTDAGPGTFEWWYFDTWLDDGSTAVIVYATKPLRQRNDPLIPMITLTITRPDGSKLGAAPLVYPADQFKAAQDCCQVNIGSSWVRGDLHHYELHAEGKELAADLTFTGQAPSWRPGAGKTYFDNALSSYFAWLVPIPYGQVEGTLTYDGKTHSVKGAGYHDHNWGNLGLERVISHWYWGRAHVGDFTVIFVEIETGRSHGRQKIPIFMLAEKDRILVDKGQALTLKTADFQDHQSGKRYPRSLDFHWQASAGTVHIKLRQPRLIDTFSLLESMPSWKQWLIRLIANPYYFRFNAEMELDVKLAETQVVERGPALYEFMLLN